MRVKWGVLGTASIAANCTIPGMMKAENCELYAIAGRSLEKVELYKERFGFQIGYVGYDRLLADPDVEAVYIPLPNDIHKEWVIKALNAGKHVLCEKPLALNAQEVKEMFDAAKRNNVILMEAYAYLHGLYVESLCKDVASGIIGDLVYIDTAFLTQGYKQDFRLHKHLGGGMIYDLGCYCTTMILSLLQASSSDKEYASDTYQPVYVRASAEMSDEAEELGQAEPGDRVDAFAGAILKFPGGIRASFDVGMILGVNGFGRYDRLYIHGTKGAIRSEVEYNQEGDLTYKILTGSDVIERKVVVDQNYKLEVEQLGRCIREGQAPHITSAFSVRNAEILDAVLKAVDY